MVQDNIFALLTRGGSLHKCRASLDSPLMQKRQGRLQQQHQDGSGQAHDGKTKERATSDSPCSAESVRARNSISVKGVVAVPRPFLSFSDQMAPETETGEVKEIISDGERNSQEGPSRLPVWLVSRLQALGYKHPTPIQMQVSLPHQLVPYL